MKQRNIGFLSGNLLKLIAAISMVVDHAGLLFFPQQDIFRILGRLAFPIYAFFIAEGCHYTKNRLRYFLQIFLLGALCQAVYFFVSGDTYLNILLTFSCSILLIYLLQQVQASSHFLWKLAFVAAIVLTALLTRQVQIDYGFAGILVPVFASVLHPARRNLLHTKDLLLSVALLGIGLLLLSYSNGSVQYYSLLTLPLLLLYSGQRGKGNFKYAFYLFYPLHLVVLQAIAWLLS